VRSIPPLFFLYVDRPAKRPPSDWLELHLALARPALAPAQARMSSDGHLVDYHVMLHRTEPLVGMFDAPGFTMLVRATSDDDALSQAENVNRSLNGLFRIVNIHKGSVGCACPAKPE
jgi:hypothetical protein